MLWQSSSNYNFFALLFSAPDVFFNGAYTSFFSSPFTTESDSKLICAATQNMWSWKFCDFSVFRCRQFFVLFSVRLCFLKHHHFAMFAKHFLLHPCKPTQGETLDWNEFILVQKMNLLQNRAAPNHICLFCSLTYRIWSFTVHIWHKSALDDWFDKISNVKMSVWMISLTTTFWQSKNTKYTDWPFC